MNMLETLVAWLQQLPPSGVLAFMFAVSFIENIFPPSPSDMMLVFAGTLITVGTVGFPESLLAATAGSVAGFMVAYAAGRYFENLLETRLGRYLPVDSIQQVERLFQRYGYGVIVANRFLSGTRAVVSFFAGMSKMSLPLTTALCAVSAAAWNAILLYLGVGFGKNWRRGAEYLETYSKVVTALLFLAIGIGGYVYFRRRKARSLASPAGENRDGQEKTEQTDITE